MKPNAWHLQRRQLLGGLAAGTALAATGLGRAAAPVFPSPPAGVAPSNLAGDEAFWAEIASYYDRTAGIVNLEHGYWGKMAHPVQQAYMDATRMVNAQNSFYARKDYDADHQGAVRRIATALGAHEDEIVITRNATEAIHNLIRQYRGLQKGDEVLLADIDYPAFKAAMHWLEGARGVRAIELELPIRANQEQLLELYIQVFDTHPGLKLLLLTHVSNQQGLVVPVAAITAEARRRGIDVICDAAQSWGLLDFQINELGVDWVGFNLHKWIGTPVGVGALYMRRGSLEKIAPYPGEDDPDNTRAATRVHMGTNNFAAVLAIPAALDFHEALGPPNKEARLRYLRGLWSGPALQMQHLEVLGGTDEPSWTGIGSFRLKGRTTIEDATALQQRLEKEFGLFTVVRKGLASGGCVRVTPQVFTSAEEIGRLVAALDQMAARNPGPS